MLLTYWNAFLKKTSIVEYTTWFLYLMCASLSKLLMYLQRSFIRCKISPKLLKKRDKNSEFYTDSETKGKNVQRTLKTSCFSWGYPPAVHHWRMWVHTSETSLNTWYDSLCWGTWGRIPHSTIVLTNNFHQQRFSLGTNLKLLPESMFLLYIVQC